ncbi:putative protein YqeY [Abditibacteriota bacterium]|nr:putative protein YqeY [Abditibacteriota bacterium]
MTSLQETITNAWKEALRAGETGRRDTLSGLRAAIKNQEIETRATLSDEAVQAVVNKEAKKRREAITEYQKAGRDDLAAREQSELDILSAFLPTQLSDDELRSLVAATVASVGAQSPKDMGTVMKALQPQIAGKADGKLASNMVKEALSK